MYKWNFDFDLFMIYLVHLKVQNTQKKKKKKKKCMNIKMKMRSFFLIHTLLFWRKKKDERWTKKENHYENSIHILMNESLKMHKVNVFELRGQ